MINDTDKAREYIIKEILPKFKDKSFHNYIVNRLAGDFAWNLANAWEEIKLKREVKNK